MGQLADGGGDKGGLACHMLRFSPAKARAATATTGNGSKDTMHKQETLKSAGNVVEAARHVELQIATNRVQTALKLSPSCMWNIIKGRSRSTDALARYTSQV